MKTVQQWIDEYLSPEERERFVRNAEPHYLNMRSERLYECIMSAFAFPAGEVEEWYSIAKRTEPYNPQRPIIGTPLDWND